MKRESVQMDLNDKEISVSASFFDTSPTGLEELLLLGHMAIDSYSGSGDYTERLAGDRGSHSRSGRWISLLGGGHRHDNLGWAPSGLSETYES